MSNDYRYKIFGVNSEDVITEPITRDRLFDEGLRPHTLARSSDVNTALKEVSLITTSLLAWIDNTGPVTIPEVPQEVNDYIENFRRTARTKVDHLIQQRITNINSSGEIALTGGTNIISGSRGIVNNSTATSLLSTNSIPTERTVRNALARINNFEQNNSINIFAPTSVGTGLPRRNAEGQWAWSGNIEGANTFLGTTTFTGAVTFNQNAATQSSVPTTAIQIANANENTGTNGTGNGTNNQRLNVVLNNLSNQIRTLRNPSTGVLMLSGGTVTGNIAAGNSAQLTGTWSGNRTLNGTTTFGGAVAMNQGLTLNGGLNINGSIVAHNLSAAHGRLIHSFPSSANSQAHQFTNIPIGVRLFILIITGPNGNQEHFTFHPNFRADSDSTNNSSFGTRTCELREHAFSNSNASRFLFQIFNVSYIAGDPLGTFSFILGQRTRQTGWGNRFSAEVKLTAELICL